MNQPICTECKCHSSTSSGDRCLAEPRERPGVKSPIDGKPGWRVVGGGFTTVSQHPLCTCCNTLNNPCELYQSLFPPPPPKRDLFVKETENGKE